MKYICRIPLGWREFKPVDWRAVSNQEEAGILHKPWKCLGFIRQGNQIEHFYEGYVARSTGRQVDRSTGTLSPRTSAGWAAHGFTDAAR